MSIPCYVHPSSGVCLETGTHLAGCGLSACRGCVGCARHTPALMALKAAAAARFPVSFDTEAGR